ncbi:MAG: hypothetical protein P1U67_00020 [Alcanivoracaceae bacterium]|nr:hypothetical protein [Alcanivoracaceae bacterium]
MFVHVLRPIMSVTYLASAPAKLLRVLFMLLISIAASPAQANGEYDSFLLDVFRLERCGFMSTSETARAGRADDCRAVLEQAEQEVSSVSDADVARQADVRNKWIALRTIYEAALNDPQRFREPITADKIRFGREALVSSLQSDLPKPPSPVALAIQMERIATEYVWRAESVMGAGMSATEILDIEKMVSEADRQFNSLASRFGKDANFRAIYAKYEFIRTSLINYNSDTVPYIVDLYTDKISKGLGDMARI